MDNWILPLDVDNRQFHIQITQPGSYDWHSTPEQQSVCKNCMRQKDHPNLQNIHIPLGFAIFRYGNMIDWLSFRRVKSIKLIRQHAALNNFVRSGGHALRDIYQSVPTYRIDDEVVEPARIVWIDLDPDTPIQHVGNITYVSRINVKYPLQMRNFSLVTDMVQTLQELASVIAADSVLSERIFDKIWNLNLTPEWQHDFSQAILENAVPIASLCCYDRCFIEWLALVLDYNSEQVLTAFIQQSQSHTHSREIKYMISVEKTDIDVLKCAIRHGFYVKDLYLRDVVLLGDQDKIYFAENLGLKLTPELRTRLLQKMVYRARKGLYLPEDNVRLQPEDVRNIYHKYLSDWSESEKIYFVWLAVLYHSTSLLDEFLSNMDRWTFSTYCQEIMKGPDSETNLISDIIWYADLDMVEYLLQQGFAIPDMAVIRSLNLYRDSDEAKFDIANYLIRNNYCQMGDRSSLYMAITRRIHDYCKLYLAEKPEWISYLDDLVALSVVLKNKECIELIWQQLCHWQMYDVIDQLCESLKWWHNRLPYKGKFGTFLQKMIQDLLA